MKEKKEHKCQTPSTDRHGDGHSKKSGFDRRQFLKTIGAVAAGAAGTGVIGAVDGCVPAPAPTPGGCNGGSPGVIQLSVPSPPVGRATVSIVGGGANNPSAGQIHEMVRNAIELAGGLDAISQGETVCIKPNLTAGDRVIATNSEVMRGVILEVKKRTAASNITVAEKSAFTSSTRNAARTVGLLDVCNQEGVNFVAWEDTPYVQANCSAWTHIRNNVQIPRQLTDGTYDHFIGVPKLKNHEMVPGANADYTCCLKLHVGVLHPTTRMTTGGGIHTMDLGNKVGEMNLTVPYHTMDVVDALDVILTGGPSRGTVASPGVILASKDRVACDSLAVAVLRTYAKRRGIMRPYVNKSVWRQAAIVTALSLNVGRGQGNIDIVDMNVAELNAIMNNWS